MPRAWEIGYMQPCINCQGKSATHFVYFWNLKTLPYTHLEATSYIPEQGQSLHIWTTSLSTIGCYKNYLFYHCTGFSFSHMVWKEMWHWVSVHLLTRLGWGQTWLLWDPSQYPPTRYMNFHHQHSHTSPRMHVWKQALCSTQAMFRKTKVWYVHTPLINKQLAGWTLQLYKSANVIFN